MCVCVHLCAQRANEITGEHSKTCNYLFPKSWFSVSLPSSSSLSNRQNQMKLSGLRTDKTRTTQRTVMVTVTLTYPCKNDDNLVFKILAFASFCIKLHETVDARKWYWDKEWILEMCVWRCVRSKYGLWLPLWVIHVVHAWMLSVSVCIVTQVDEFSNVPGRFSLSPSGTGNLCFGYSTSCSRFVAWMRLTSGLWWFLISLSGCSAVCVCISVRQELDLGVWQ